MSLGAFHDGGCVWIVLLPSVCFLASMCPLLERRDDDACDIQHGHINLTRKSQLAWRVYRHVGVMCVVVMRPIICS